ncbi:type II secretion system protein [Candidatus Uhrbacteria bacterium]|nr:type II secretion system protein [Candidatus Uhrbacteria bacterium]
MRSSKAQGFTFTEAMISVAILGIIATAAGYSLRTSQYRDQLRSAGRVVAADLRSLQARAIAGSNIKFCTIAGQKAVCENSSAACTDACTAVAPAGVGMRLNKNATAYDLFAKYDPNTTDWRESNAGEIFMTRDLVRSGALNVTISNLQGMVMFNTVDVAFQRQNGNMLIDVCPVGCTNQNFMNITLTHSKLPTQPLTVSMNKLTGRISIEE